MNNKVNLKDTTFCIPIFIDSIDRKQNLELILKYLDSKFNTNIIIGEIYYNVPILEYLKKDFKYISYKNTERYFHKTKILNMMYLESDTPYLISYDCDALFPVNQLEKCVNSLRSNKYDACFPFKNNVIQLSRSSYKTLYDKLDLNEIKKYPNVKSKFPFEGLALGMTRNIIYKIGFENENFKGWGIEDTEREYRIKLFGGKVGKVPGVGYHLNHFRGVYNSNQNEYYNLNKREFTKIKSFNSPDLVIKYFNKFSWYNELKNSFKSNKSNNILKKKIYEEIDDIKGDIYEDTEEDIYEDEFEEDFSNEIVKDEEITIEDIKNFFQSLFISTKDLVTFEDFARKIYEYDFDRNVFKGKERYIYDSLMQIIDELNSELNQKEITPISEKRKKIFSKDFEFKTNELRRGRPNTQSLINEEEDDEDFEEEEDDQFEFEENLDEFDYDNESSVDENNCGFDLKEIRNNRKTINKKQYLTTAPVSVKNNEKEFEEDKFEETLKNYIEKLKGINEKENNVINNVNNNENNRNNNKIDFLGKLTFIIPFHYDTNDRLENVNLCLNYLYKNVKAKIIVGEMGPVRKFQYELHKDKEYFSYKFGKQKIFTKTKLINSLVKTVDTEFFCLHDTDVFLTFDQYSGLRSHIDHGLLDVIIPYNGLYLEIPRKFIPKIENIFDIKELDSYCSYRFLKEHYLGTGACIAFKKNSFIECGMMNQFFKKWGLEDDEVVYRMFALGKNILRMNSSDPIHHLIHRINQKEFGYIKHNLTELQQKEYDRVKLMNFGTMKSYASKLFKENI